MSKTATDELLTAIRQVAGISSSDSPIALHEPNFYGTNAWTYVKDCIDTGWVSSAGTWVSRFEEGLCKVTGASHAVAVTNGTVALRLALHVVGVSAGDEVLVPPLSFVATANAVTHLGAVPHFIDIDCTTLGMCPAALRARLVAVALRRDGNWYNRITGRRIAAVLPVHVFGHPADGPALRTVADEWELPLVEDAAEALGSWRGTTHCGLFGTVGTLSFNGNKLLTTGGGGAVLTNNSVLAQRARHISTTAKLPHPWVFEHDEVGWNDRLPNLNAALGVAQLEDLECRLQAKRKLADRYSAVLSSVSGVELVAEPTGSRSNHWLVSLRFTAPEVSECIRQRDDLLEAAHDHGLQLRPAWQLLHRLRMYRDNPRSKLSVAEDQAVRLVSLPSSPQLVK